ncbi:MAG: histidine kinase N-terminal domain-containing protein [Schwartzia sp.]|nr:histidine kinase N-terminal domain-containing protein [Schwartzia sp. (in: firmicutes)]
MDDIRALCRAHTDISGRQAELLKNIGEGLPFIADLAQAQASLYAPARDGERFLVLAQARSNTMVQALRLAPVGDFVPRLEEPLISRTLETGKPCVGLREQPSLPDSLEMHTYGIHDGLDAIAVVSLEVPAGQLMDRGSRCLVETARMILQNARSALDPKAYRAISPRDGILIADEYDRIIYANAAACHIFRVLGVGSLLGLRLDAPDFKRHITRETVMPDRPTEKEIEAGGLVLLRRDLPILAGGRRLRRVIVVEDVTALRQKEEELLVQEAVIREIHHRVKNNLQIIASLLRLQARRSREAAVKDALGESVHRIQGIAAIHRLLSRQGMKPVDVHALAGEILDLLTTSQLAPDFRLERRFTGDTFLLPPDECTDLALVVNELLMNAIDHAFRGRPRGRIDFDVRVGEREATLVIADDGVGLPRDFSVKEASSLGLQLVRTLVEVDLGGRIVFEGDEGTRIRITLPRKEAQESWSPSRS